MQKTDSTPGCSCSMVGLAWDSFEFLSKDMLVRYEMGAGVSVWAAYKPEGFSMFGRGIVEDCGQNSPPSGLIQKLETLLKLMFLFLRLSWIATFVFLVTSKIFILQFLAGLSILAWIRSIVSDPVSIIVHCQWLTLGFVVPLASNVFCCNVLQCFQKKCDMLQSCFPFFPKFSAVYGGWLSVCLVTKNIYPQPGDRMFFKSCLISSSWCALPYNSEFGVETFDKFSADSLSAFKLILLSHLGIIFSFSNRKDAISKTCNIQYTKYDWMGWSFNIVNVQI